MAEELYKKDLHDPDNHDGVITDLEPDILECEVKWSLESITTNKASGGDGIPVELFQILKDDAVKVLHSIGQQIWKTQQWPQDWKRSVFIPVPKKGNAKEYSNYLTIALISHTSTWRRKWQSTPVLLPGKSHGRRSLVGYSSWDHKESGTTERFHFHFSWVTWGEHVERGPSEAPFPSAPGWLVNVLPALPTCRGARTMFQPHITAQGRGHFVQTA